MSRRLAVAALLVLLVLLAGCGSKKKTETTTTVPLTTDVLAIDSAFSSPETITAGEPFDVVTMISNVGGIPAVNINAVFYNFGPNIDGCPEVFIGELAPGEQQEVVCRITPKEQGYWADSSQASFTQEMSLKVQYSFDVEGAYESIRVLSPDEFARTNPAIKSESKTVELGPVIMKAEFQKQPAQAGKEFPIALSFSLKKSTSEGIETVHGVQVESVQLQVPATFMVTSKGGFESVLFGCEAGYTCVQRRGWDIYTKPNSTLMMTLMPPLISVPEETYSAKFAASGFTVFRILSKKVTVNAA